LILRRAVEDDAPAIAVVHRTAMRVSLQLTDGARNEEKTPDALYEWRAKLSEAL
jgi:hypothetical protein